MAGEGGDELRVICNDYLCYFEWKIFSKADEVIKVSKLWGEDGGWKTRTGVEKHIICDIINHQWCKNSLFLFALLFFAMRFLKLVMDVLDHKGGGRTTRTMWATRRRWTPRRWTSRRWSQRVWEEGWGDGLQDHQGKPFFLQYVPIFLNGIVKVDVVVMKVVNDNNDEGEKKRK